MGYTAMRIAHRGDGKAAPENTFDSIKAAVEHGCEAVEIDVRLTKDNKIVLMHDEKIDRMVFDGNEKKADKKLGAMTWSDISALKIPYENHLLPDFPEEGFEQEQLLFESVNARMLGEDPKHPYRNTGQYTSPALLEEIIVWLQQTGSDIFIEVECKDRGMAPFLEELINKTGSHDMIILMSGDSDIIDEFQDYFKRQNYSENIKLGANIRILDIQWKTKLEDMEFYEVGLNVENITNDSVEYLHKRDIKVFSNLGDYKEWWAEIPKLKIDGFKTNYIREYTTWFNDHKS
ncbi:MAG: hypothetical protein B6241_05935 [Spirochaetaceae bacterium 4572_59]|nr:MAG: hypothetical protein B6241_05935 [Spirochaetaceae bacterium 4572_59]